MLNEGYTGQIAEPRKLGLSWETKRRLATYVIFPNLRDKVFIVMFEAEDHPTVISATGM